MIKHLNNITLLLIIALISLACGGIDGTGEGVESATSAAFDGTSSLLEIQSFAEEQQIGIEPVQDQGSGSGNESILFNTQGIVESVDHAASKMTILNNILSYSSNSTLQSNEFRLSFQEIQVGDWIQAEVDLVENELWINEAVVVSEQTQSILKGQVTAIESEAVVIDHMRKELPESVSFNGETMSRTEFLNRIAIGQNIEISQPL